jgi:hypothetical protein
LDVGFSIDPQVPKFAENLLDQLEVSEIIKKRKHCLEVETEDLLIPKDLFRDTVTALV